MIYHLAILLHLSASIKVESFIVVHMEMLDFLLVTSVPGDFCPRMLALTLHTACHENGVPWERQF